ncbi:MAG: hypothetical protein AAFR27_08180, partial [Pseudomonadota bacterium]
QNLRDQKSQCITLDIRTIPLHNHSLPTRMAFNNSPSLYIQRLRSQHHFIRQRQQCHLTRLLLRQAMLRSLSQFL